MTGSKSTSINGGQRANSSGRRSEDVIATVLHGQGLEFTRQAQIGWTIYGGSLCVDFLVTNAAGFPAGLIIESKWQDVGGSADEKFPYLVANLRAAQLPSVIVIHGGGQRDGAIAWLRSQVDGEKIIAAFALEEFISWAYRSLALLES